MDWDVLEVSVCVWFQVTFWVTDSLFIHHTFVLIIVDESHPKMYYVTYVRMYVCNVT